MKDYYQILGIRQNASKEEIELAYRGRRTQYHPDKYPNSDEATLKWANENMQEVNIAYGILSDIGRREKYDEIIKNSHEQEPINSGDLYEAAKSTVLNNQRATISLLQRKLRVSYAKAVELLSQLELDGIVGPMDSSGNRTVYSTSTQSDSNDIDEYNYKQAVHTVRENGIGSISLVQRTLELEYKYVKNIFERMEQEGILGPLKDDGQRNLITNTAQRQ